MTVFLFAETRLTLYKGAKRCCMIGIFDKKFSIPDSYKNWQGPWLIVDEQKLPLDFPAVEGTGTVRVSMNGNISLEAIAGDVTFGDMTCRDGELYLGSMPLSFYIDSFQAR